MSRPLPVIPRGVKRRGVRAPTLLLGCPRVSPEWELGALRVLMRPKGEYTVRPRNAEQHWPERGDEIVAEIVRAVEERTGYRVNVDVRADGEYHFIGKVRREELEKAKALAAALSRGLTGLWIVLGRVYVRDGRFYRRERGIKLRLVPAKNVHLWRELRARLGDLL